MDKQLEQVNFEQELHGIKIPPQPQIMVDLYMEMVNPYLELPKISAIISKDVGISGGVLKIVNSPFFGLRNKITSISQALNLLGTANVVNLVNTLSIRSSLSENALADMTRFWDNSVDVASACAAISRKIGIVAPDEAYTLGLFHNTGIPLLMEKYPNYPSFMKTSYAQSKQRITDVENELIGSNHAVVGYYVAKAWKLPRYLCEAIADHHKTELFFRDEQPCGSQKKNLLAILKLAESICKTHQMLGQSGEDHEFAAIKSSILLYLGISEYDYDDIMAEIVDLI